MSEYFPEQKSSGGRVKVELDLSNYATKADLKNTTGVDTSKFAKKIDLASSKSNVEKSDINKLKNVRSNESNLIKNTIKKYNAKIKNIDDKIPDITNLATNTTQNAKINVVEGEITSITNLATAAALNTKINEV